jgi:hypothetical protein
MFKKLMSFLFEEVDVIEEEIEPSYDPSLSQEPASVSKMKMIDLEEEVPVVEEVPLVAQKSFNLELERVEKKVEMKIPQPKVVVKSEPYQAKGIISPIFGKKEQVITHTKVSQAPLPLPSENTSVLGTVFSPIYGVVKAKPIQTKNQAVTPKHVSIDELFNDEPVIKKVSTQPTLDDLFDEQPVQKSTPVQVIEEIEEDNSSDHEEENVQMLFRSLFDEQE